MASIWRWGLSLHLTVDLLQHILIASCACGLVALIGLILYQVTLHPLAKYPGPVIGKFTNLHAAYHSWKGDLHLEMLHAHEKYGSIVRYAPNSIIVNTATAMDDIYARGKKFQKSKKYNVLVFRAPNLMTSIDKKRHSRKRRVISQGFSDGALKDYESLILEKIQDLCHQMQLTEENSRALELGQWSSARNMAHWCDYFSFDTMTSVIFDVSFSLLKDPKYRFVPGAIASSNVRIGSTSQAPIELAQTGLWNWIYPDALKSRDRLVGFLDEMMRAAHERSTKEDISDAETAQPKSRSKSGSVFALLRAATDYETGLPLKAREIAGESATLIIAGMDTTSTALAGCLFYLCRNPDAYRRVASEVRTMFKSVDKIRFGQELRECTYLKACIDESLRMSPPGASAMYRETEAGGAVVDNNWFPGGIEVGTPIYAIHHNPEYFPDPFTFQPERWLESDQGGQPAKANLAAFCPFSHGPRSCIGKNLAMMQLELTLAHLICVFDFRRPDGPEGTIGEGKPEADRGRRRINEFQLYDHITCSKDGPYVEFCPRSYY